MARTIVAPAPRTVPDEAAARGSMRAQIAKLERELATLFSEVFPRRGFDLAAAGDFGPRLLDLGELERLRDRLADRVEGARDELRRRQAVERQNVRLIDRMIADPAGHKWVQVSADDVGGRACKHWHSLPRLGIVGMMLGWWRVKISSGCP